MSALLLDLKTAGLEVLRLYRASLVGFGAGDATIDDAIDLVGQGGDGIRRAHHLFAADISLDLAGYNQDFLLRCSFSHNL